jgi:hypothetical protein
MTAAKGPAATTAEAASDKQKPPHDWSFIEAPQKINEPGVPYLRETLLLLVLAGLFIPLLQRLRINQVLGFLAVGTVLGPLDQAPHIPTHRKWRPAPRLRLA